MKAAALLLALLLSAAPARADDVPPDAVVAVLPFGKAEEPNRILLDLAPDGAPPFPLLLDTGASISVLTPLAARAAGVSVRRHKSEPYRRRTRLGRDLLFQVDTSSSDTGSKTGWEYGVVGGDFLEAYVVEIDFTMRVVRFLDPDRFRVPEGATEPEEAVVPFTLTAHRPSLEVAIDGRPLRLLLETGVQPALVLSGDAARSVGIDPDALPDTGTLGTTLGPMQVRFHEVRSLSIGGLAVGPVPALVSPRGWYNLAGRSDSVVAYDVLSRFLVRIDYPRRRLWLRRESEAVPFFGSDYGAMSAAGAVVYEDPIGEIAVLVVRPGTPAERRGLRRGDQILRDGPGGRRLSVPEVLDALQGEAPLRVVRDEGGVPREHTLAAPAAAEDASAAN
ncbi:MAG: aspartyl protease family protein [Deltaproteobacteria bacterium]|nr:aspartyl protease family protein [Deltaproteobacteria bacterium]